MARGDAEELGALPGQRFQGRHRLPGHAVGGGEDHRLGRSADGGGADGDPARLAVRRRGRERSPAGDRAQGGRRFQRPDVPFAALRQIAGWPSAAPTARATPPTICIEATLTGPRWPEYPASVAPAKAGGAPFPDGGTLAVAAGAAGEAGEAGEAAPVFDRGTSISLALPVSIISAPAPTVTMTAAGTPIVAACKARRRRGEVPGRDGDHGRARRRRLPDGPLPRSEQLIGLAQRRRSAQARWHCRAGESGRADGAWRLRADHDRRAERHLPAADRPGLPGEPTGRVHPIPQRRPGIIGGRERRLPGDRGGRDSGSIGATPESAK